MNRSGIYIVKFLFYIQLIHSSLTSFYSSMSFLSVWIVLLSTVTAVLPRVQGQPLIEAFPSTQTIPLGKSVVLVCKAPGESSTLSYQWSCPGGNCDESTSTQGTPRSRIVNGNTLTVNVVSESDAGEYTCTVSVTGGDSTQTASYTLDVEGGIALYQQAARSPIAVYSSGSVFLTTNSFAAGFNGVAVKCVGPDSTSGQWFDPKGSAISTFLGANVKQEGGELFVTLLDHADYFNGNYKCKVGSEEAILGLYFRTALLPGTSGTKVANLISTQTSSSSVRLSWNQLSNAARRKARGFFVSYGIIDHDVVENVVVEGGSTTSVDLTNLPPGVEYEATVWRFGRDGAYRVVSTKARVRWTVEAEITTVATSEVVMPSSVPELVAIVSNSGSDITSSSLQSPTVIPMYRPEFTTEVASGLLHQLSSTDIVVQTSSTARMLPSTYTSSDLAVSSKLLVESAHPESIVPTFALETLMEMSTYETIISFGLTTSIESLLRRSSLETHILSDFISESTVLISKLQLVATVTTSSSKSEFSKSHFLTVAPASYSPEFTAEALESITETVSQSVVPSFNSETTTVTAASRSDSTIQYSFPQSIVPNSSSEFVALPYNSIGLTEITSNLESVHSTSSLASESVVLLTASSESVIDVTSSESEFMVPTSDSESVAQISSSESAISPSISVTRIFIAASSSNSVYPTSESASSSESVLLSASTSEPPPVIPSSATAVSSISSSEVVDITSSATSEVVTSSSVSETVVPATSSVSDIGSASSESSSVIPTSSPESVLDSFSVLTTSTTQISPTLVPAVPTTTQVTSVTPTAPFTSPIAPDTSSTVSQSPPVKNTSGSDIAGEIIGASVGVVAGILVLLVAVILIIIIVLVLIFSVKKAAHSQSLHYGNGTKYWATQESDTKL